MLAGPVVDSWAVPPPCPPGRRGSSPVTCAPQGGQLGPEEIGETVLDRFNKESGTVRLTLVQPVVAEVSADVAWSGFVPSRSPIAEGPEPDPGDVQFPRRSPRMISWICGFRSSAGVVECRTLAIEPHRPCANQINPATTGRYAARP